MKKKSVFRKLPLVVLFLFCSLLAAAQNKTITGVVTDNTGETLPGVTIKAKGTIKTVVSDMDGKYAIQIPAAANTLVFTFIGMKQEEVQIGDKSVVNVTMQNNDYKVNEVVVVGYGTQKKRDITAAISSVGQEKLEQKVPVNALDALQGEMAGVQITSISGAPGSGSSIRIRGASTFEQDGAEPLYIVDGVIMEGISNLNPNDIKSIEVLKDAASTAIYGARSANGVILVTTKSGEDGKPRIDARYLQSYGTLANTLPQLNRAEREIFENTIQSVNSRIPFAMFKSNTDSVNLQAKTANNYQRLISKTAVRNDANISIAGGGKTLRTFTSLGYLNDQGIIYTSYLKRFTGRSKVDYTPFKFLTFSSNITASYENKNEINEGTVFYNAIRRPTQSLVWFPDGTLVPVWASNPSGKRNPIQELYERTNLTDKYSATIFESVQLNFDKYTKLIGRATSNLYYASNFNYSGPNVTTTAKASAEAGADKGNDKTMFYNNYLIDGYFDYARSFAGSHNVHLMVGGSVEDRTLTTRQMPAEYYLNKSMLLPQAATIIGIPTITAKSNSMASLFGRLEYNYKGRYIFSGSIRKDGSSRFGVENRWGVFPAASAGWRFSDETFLDWSRDVLTDGKLRLSWGVNGNDRVGEYDAQTLYTLGGNSYNGVTVVTPLSRVGNEFLKWEETTQQNIGLDLTFWNGVLAVTADYYVKTTTDLFNDDNIPTELGFSSMRVNIGSVENRGIELNVTAYPVRTKDWTWMTSVNWSKNDNKILSIVGDPYELNGNWWVEPNMAAGNFYGYKNLGVYAYDASNAYTQDYKTRLTPVFQRDEQGNVVILNVGGPKLIGYKNPDGTVYATVQPDGTLDNPIYKTKAEGTVAKGGDVIWEDVDKNGIIDAADKQVLGNATPKWYTGWSNSVKYKAITLNFSMYMSFGGLIYNQMLRDLTSYGDNTSNCDPRGALQGWRYQGHLTNWFTPGQNARSTNNARSLSSFYLEDASFIRLQNVRLSYQLPNNLASQYHLQGLQVYGYCNNLLTWTNYRGYDPEVSTGGILNPGADNQKYPKKREFGFGVNLSF
ncbi:MAG TPA: TonB-dependent receptor [Bacteroidales bacterium]|nr:TonB-dependent receptor [Bacteroidales bacterium]